MVLRELRMVGIEIINPTYGSRTKFSDEMIDRAAEVERIITIEYPLLLSFAKIYNNEALQARYLIEEDLLALPKQAKILEIGAGNLALSIQLASEGYFVCAIEPVGSGFNPMRVFIETYLKIASDSKIVLEFQDVKIENFKSPTKFDYCFAINVLEHVDDPRQVIHHVMTMASNNFRIYCPNYDFPYEPHFGKFLFHRKNQAFYLKRQEAINPDLYDAAGLYESLNFITFRKLKATILELRLVAKVNKNVNLELLSRATSDEYLNGRHKILAKVSWIFSHLGIKWFLKLVPLRWSPVIDLTISRV